MVIPEVKTFTLRLTEDQHEILERRAQEANLSKNQFIINLILEEEINYKSFDDQLKNMTEQIAEADIIRKTNQIKLDEINKRIDLLTNHYNESTSTDTQKE